MPAPLDLDAIEAVAAEFGNSRTLPADAYRSADVFAWERETIFESGWVCVGRTDDLALPGQLRAIDHGGESVLLARDQDGTLRAFSNVCRHRGHILVEPGDAIDARQIRCPYHSWAYRFDGELRTAPLLTQTDDFEASQWGLVSIRAGTWMGWAFLDPSGVAPDLTATFGNASELLARYEPERLRLGARHAYEVKANWKLVTENYHECYHCTSIHPELCEVTPHDSGADHQPTGLWCGGTMYLKDHASTMSLSGESLGVAFRLLEDGHLREVVYVGLWPNLLVSAHPDYVMTHRIVPLAPDRTFIECDWLWAPDSFEADGFSTDYATDFWDITNKEDWTACEQVQRATVNRGFRPGPLSPMETTMYQFLGLVAKAYLDRPMTPPTVPHNRLYKLTDV